MPNEHIDMEIPTVSFAFTQSSLQDYLDCPRRFQLRYVLDQPWPAVESEPLIERERLADLGRRFHQMAQRHTVGLPVEQIAASAQDADLIRWWWNYLNVPPRDLPSSVRRAEVMLTAPLGAHRLSAKYDLLALDPGRRAVIVDWKTERKRPTRPQLAARMQTRVYRYVLVEAGAALNGGRPIEPEQVTMVYWFAAFPAEPEVFPYDSAQHADDAASLSGLVEEIAVRAEVEWPKTDDKKRCHYCTYRSLCDRGTTAGTGDESEAEVDLDIELEKVEEIAY
jgi:CRISPR/Cas system-associated exonuclease Cas4 (RecB family)